jgi:hypothetical protein
VKTSPRCRGRNTDRVSLLADTKDGEKPPARWVRQVVSIEVITP